MDIGNSAAPNERVTTVQNENAKACKINFRHYDGHIMHSTPPRACQHDKRIGLCLIYITTPLTAAYSTEPSVTDMQWLQGRQCRLNASWMSPLTSIAKIIIKKKTARAGATAPTQVLILSLLFYPFFLHLRASTAALEGAQRQFATNDQGGATCLLNADWCFWETQHCRGQCRTRQTNPRLGTTPSRNACPTLSARTSPPFIMSHPTT